LTGLSGFREQFLRTRGVLSLPEYSEYDYPLVENDIPVSKLAREMVPVIAGLFSSEKDYLRILDMALLHLLALEKKMPSLSRKIRPLVKKYRDYPEIIRRKTHYGLQDDRNDLQLMITGRRRLRCGYCDNVTRKFIDSPDNIGDIL